MAGIDINRTTAGINLPVAVSNEIWSTTISESAAMRLARRITLPGGGVSVPIITGDVSAEWVDETAEKPLSRSTFGNKAMTPYKLAVIEPFSNEFKRDLPGLYAECARRLPLALGKKFDETVFGLQAGAPGSNFDTLGDATSVGIAGNTWGGLVAADTAVALAGGSLTGWALAPQARALLLTAVDGDGRPLYINNVSESNVPNLLGAPVFQTTAVYAADADAGGAGTDAQLGFVGDWNSAFYGTVEGIQLSTSTEATLNDGGTQLNLWQRNMFAIRAEIEVGFRIRDIDHFVRLTSAVQPA